METDYDSTVAWALEEEKIRVDRGKAYSTFYLFMGSICILLLCFFVLYYFNRGEKYEFESLNIAKDPENIFIEDDFSNEVIEEIKEEVKPIEIEEV